MAHARIWRPSSPAPTPARLDALMAGLGMSIAANPEVDASIEDVLLWASQEGMDKGDLRVLGVLTQWLEEHHLVVRAARLIRLVKECAFLRVQAYWAAVSHWLEHDLRLKKLAKLAPTKRLDLVEEQEFWLMRDGEDPRFAGGPLVVAVGSLRIRQGDTDLPHKIAARHPAYRARLLMGPVPRADVWAQLWQDSSLHPAELARQAYCAYSAAWRAHRDFHLLYPSPKSL